MAAALEVDTDAVRRAAAGIAGAAAGLRTHHADLLPPMPDGTLGTTAEAREVQALAQRRTAQALELIDGLAGAADDLADRVCGVADLFDGVEAAARGP